VFKLAGPNHIGSSQLRQINIKITSLYLCSTYHPKHNCILTYSTQHAMVMNQICMHWSSQYRTPAQLIFKPSLADPSCSSNDTHMHRQKYTHHGFFSSPSEHSVPTFFFFSSSWLAESKMRPDFCILGCFLALADCWMSWSWASSSSSLSMGSWYGI